MLIPNPKKAATVIVNRLKPESGESSDKGEFKHEESMEPEMHGMHSAMEDLLSAMNEKSSIGMHKAMSSYLDQHRALVNRPLAKTPQDDKFTREHEDEYSYPEK